MSDFSWPSVSEATDTASAKSWSEVAVVGNVRHPSRCLSLLRFDVTDPQSTQVIQRSPKDFLPVP